MFNVLSSCSFLHFKNHFHFCIYLDFVLKTFMGTLISAKTPFLSCKGFCNLRLFPLLKNIHSSSAWTPHFGGHGNVFLALFTGKPGWGESDRNKRQEGHIWAEHSFFSSCSLLRPFASLPGRDSAFSFNPFIHMERYDRRNDLPLTRIYCKPFPLLYIFLQSLPDLTLRILTCFPFVSSSPLLQHFSHI